jgi:hypothetical protein
VANDFAAAAVAQPSSLSTASERSRLTYEARPEIFAARAERGVEMFSRWAGIISFAAAVAAIIWFIF